MTQQFTKEEQELREAQIGDIVAGVVGMVIADFRRRAYNIQPKLLEEYRFEIAMTDSLPPIDSKYRAETTARVEEHLLQVARDTYGEQVARRTARLRKEQS